MSKEVRAEYWDDRAPFYGQTDNDVVGRYIIQSYVQHVNPTSICEVGCGTGILLKHYLNVPIVNVCDKSIPMLRILKRRIERHEWTKVKLFWHDIITEKLPDHYDLVLTRTVLMHMTQEQAEKAVQNIVLSCDQALIVELDQDPDIPRSSHCFVNDYPQLFSKHGWIMRETFRREDIPQTVFWFTKPNENAINPERSSNIGEAHDNKVGQTA